jgi:hypothetical protein
METKKTKIHIIDEGNLGVALAKGLSKFVSNKASK